MRARLLLPIFLVVLIALSVHRLVCAPSGAAVRELAGETMGTTWHVKVASDGTERERIERSIQDELDAVNAAMSTWDPESELSRFNRHSSSTPFPLSPETLEVLSVAQEVSALSGGAFDVTVGPLVEAWGFGATDRLPTPPSQSELETLRDRVGWSLLEIDVASGTASKANPALACDLSAVAKGYAVDRVARALLGLGIHDFLVEVGGEVRASGTHPGGGAWRVGIEAPDPAGRRLFGVVELRDMAMATSGDYRNFYEYEGVWLSHLIDPRTQHPIAHDLASVSVIHEDATHADALATALIVLGPEQGFELAMREGLVAHFVVRRPDGSFSARNTPGFDVEPLGAAESARQPSVDR